MTDPLAESLRPLRDRLAQEALGRLSGGAPQPGSFAPGVQGAFAQLFGPGGFAERSQPTAVNERVPNFDVSGIAPGRTTPTQQPGTAGITRQNENILRDLRGGGAPPSRTMASSSSRAQTPMGISEIRDIMRRTSGGLGGRF